MTDTLNTLADEVHANAAGHGFWPREDENTYLRQLLLIHAEVSEATEEFRNGNPSLYLDGEKPEGYAVELADVLIRTLDLMAALRIDIDAVVRRKMEYNVGRPSKHGKLF